MKKIFFSFFVALTLALTPACTKLQALYHATTAETSKETADQILIRSEQLTKQALYSFDTYLFIERNNEQLLKDKFGSKPHEVAEKIRAHGREWLQAARRTTKAFKENRTEENAANMQTAYVTLKQAYDEVQAAKSQADQLNKRSP